ncbi:MAG: hypothetical protein JXJ18_12005 [Rhodobacteraceae bacterium]|nr:hypothetical protein [Paracoccaceae bacterium]
MTTRIIAGLFAVVLLFVPAPASAGPDYDGATLAFPSACRDRIQVDGGAVSCSIPMTDGYVKIDLVFHEYGIGAFAKSIGATREKFLANPRGYMRAALRKFEDLAVKQRDSGRGKIVILSRNTRPAPATRGQIGLEECLYFDEDTHVSERSGKFLARVDLTGIRCLGHDPSIGRVWYTYTEIGAVHKTGTDRRPAEFEAFSRKILQSLRLR